MGQRRPTKNIVEGDRTLVAVEVVVDRRGVRPAGHQLHQPVGRGSEQQVSVHPVHQNSIHYIEDLMLT